jgi:Soluble lytic murein transglycosylase and related regulatory proteins (some contain LysM/invasin domains)
MKKKHGLISGGLALFLVATLILMGSKTVEIQSQDNKHTAFSATRTMSVPVPKEVTFCGQKISLERIDMHERFDREINSFTYLHSTTMLYLKRANRYFPIIEPILKEEGLPDDFKYLCVIESNLDTRAFSTAKAAGLWQFMEATGKSYGLEITTQVDERYHIEKATRAACKYLKDAYKVYGDWVNAAASYNAGMGRISGNKKSQQVESAFDMYLVSETDRYVFRILAIKEVFANPQRYGFYLNKEDLYPPVRTKQIKVTSDIDDLASFAKGHNITYKLLKDFNVWLRGTSLKVPAGKTYIIDIPLEEDLYYKI